MYLFGWIVGALAITFVVSRLLLLVLPKQDGRYIAAAVFSFVICWVLFAFGSADGGPPRWDAGLGYILPQAFWLWVDWMRSTLAWGKAGDAAQTDIGAAEPARPLASEPLARAEPSQAELVFWQSISASSNPADFEAYLEQFPSGYFRVLATNRLAALNSMTVEELLHTRAVKEAESARQGEAGADREAHDTERGAPESNPEGEREAPAKQESVAPWTVIIALVVAGGLLLLMMMNAANEVQPPGRYEIYEPGSYQAPQPAGPPLQMASPRQEATFPPMQEATQAPPVQTSLPLPEMVPIPGRNFEVGRYEVTFAQWDACVADGGCNGYRPEDGGWGRGQRPVINVSWNDAQTYVGWLSQRTGQRYRLLTSAEWEYAAVGDTKKNFGWGDYDPVCDQSARNGANFNACIEAQTRPVGSFRPNAFGLYDMHGNVWEWVYDCHDSSCSNRALRGGSWYDASYNLRSMVRVGISPSLRSNGYGFRVARSL